MRGRGPREPYHLIVGVFIKRVYLFLRYSGKAVDSTDVVLNNKNAVGLLYGDYGN